MKRIAILCNSASWGGLELNAARLAETIRKKFPCYLIIPADSPIENYAKQHGIEYHTIDRNLKYYHPGLLFSIRRILKENPVDLLFSSTTKDIYAIVFQKLFFNLKTIHIQQMQFGLTKKGPVHQLFYRNLDYWVAPLHWLEQQTALMSPVKKKKIKYIPLATDLEKFSQGPSKSEARKFLNLNTEEFLIGIIGRFDPAKGQSYLIQAFNRIHTRFPNARLLFIGEDTRGVKKSHLEELKNLVSENGMEDKVYFKPFLSNPVPAFKALDVFVMASFGETFGMVTIEALAAGLPVIGTRSGGTPEILENGEAGLLVPPKDEPALSEALEKLISQEDLRDELSRKGILRAKEFSLELYEKRIYHFIEEA